jgi:AraC-like DNA-binding protein
MNDSGIPIYELKDVSDNLKSFEFVDISNKNYDHKIMHAHRHAYYTYIFLKKGLFHQTIDFKVYNLQAPSVVCISPNQIHIHGNDDNFEAVALSFTRDFLTRIEPFPGCEGKPNIVELDKGTYPIIEILSEAMDMEYNNKEPDDRILSNLLDSFIIKINNIWFKQKDIHPVCSTSQKIVTDYYHLVDTNYKTLKNVSCYSSKMNITSNYLNGLVRRYTGSSAKKFIINRTLAEAKRLLYFDHLSVKEIANELNFNELSYFNNFFKKETGITPLQYKKGVQEKFENQM